MSIEVMSYSHDYWDEFVALVEHYWAKDHPVTNRVLFDWQYKGFGHSANFEMFKVLKVDGKLAGFRGVIPGLYHLPGSDEILPGGTFSMWLVVPELRGAGVGYKLMSAIEEECSVLMSVGSTLNTSGRIYSANNFTYLDKFHRWVVGLDSRFSALLRDDVQEHQYSPVISKGECEVRPSPAELANSWARFNERKRFFSLVRNEDFWQWRYIESPGFRYHFFGNELGDVVVARIESNIQSTKSPGERLNLLRIIEIINIGNRDSIRSLLSCVLGWAIEQDCCGADFQASNGCFHDTLNALGFLKQEGAFGAGATSLAGLFHPFRFTPDPINAFWRVRHVAGDLSFGEDQTFIMKSDNDMDRPNYWPVR